MPPEERSQLLSLLSDGQALEIWYDWASWRRADQALPPGNWQNWLALAGRGWGKTRVGAEAVREVVESEECERIALVAPTAKAARDVMIEGESGILAISPPWCRPKYEPSKCRLTWPNGATATAYSAEEPDRLRGPQHDFAWSDELAAWKRMVDTWDNLQMGLRLGDNPRNVITTTPRPQKLIRALRDDPGTIVTVGSTYDNAGNVSAKWLAKILRKYKGTRLERQELFAEVLDDVPGALWSLALLDKCRRGVHPELARVVVSIDPAVTSGEDSDSTGIIVAGLGVDYQGYILRDLTCKMLPIEWGRRAINAYHEYKANYIVAEVNNGGDLVAAVIHSIDPNIPFRAVHASRGKRIRAEPVAALYEQDRVHHVEFEREVDLCDGRGVRAGCFWELEDEMRNFAPGKMDESPDRLDAMVWAITELMLDPVAETVVLDYYDPVRLSRF